MQSVFYSIRLLFQIRLLYFSTTVHEKCNLCSWTLSLTLIMHFSIKVISIEIKFEVNLRFDVLCQCGTNFLLLVTVYKNKRIYSLSKRLQFTKSHVLRNVEKGLFRGGGKLVCCKFYLFTYTRSFYEHAFKVQKMIYKYTIIFLFSLLIFCDLY